jgi:hypothetical protein
VALDEEFTEHMRDSLSLRLWTGKSKPWDSPYTRQWFKSYRSFVEVWFNKEWKGFGLSLEGEKESMDGLYSSTLEYKSIGFQWSFGFGHEVHQYDGFWHRFSIGPFFITWHT